MGQQVTSEAAGSTWSWGAGVSGNAANHWRHLGLHLNCKGSGSWKDAEQDFQEASIGISLFSCNVTPRLVPALVIALLKSLLEPRDQTWIPSDHWLQPMCSILAGQ